MKIKALCIIVAIVLSSSIAKANDCWIMKQYYNEVVSTSEEMLRIAEESEASDETVSRLVEYYSEELFNTYNLMKIEGCLDQPQRVNVYNIYIMKTAPMVAQDPVADVMEAMQILEPILPFMVTE